MDKHWYLETEIQAAQDGTQELLVHISGDTRIYPAPGLILTCTTDPADSDHNIYRVICNEDAADAVTEGREAHPVFSFEREMVRGDHSNNTYRTASLPEGHITPLGIEALFWAFTEFD